jgi:hypothetical protein
VVGHQGPLLLAEARNLKVEVKGMKRAQVTGP